MAMTINHADESESGKIIRRITLSKRLFVLMIRVTVGLIQFPDSGSVRRQETSIMAQIAT